MPVLGVIGSLTLVMFIYGGITWMTSSGSPEKVKKGKDIIIWSVIGLAIIFFSYALVKLCYLRYYWWLKIRKNYQWLFVDNFLFDKLLSLVYYKHKLGSIPKRSNGADCKSAGFMPSLVRIQLGPQKSLLL